MEKRNLALYIVLSIVTCGIFSLIWLVMLVDDIRELANEKDGMSGGTVLVLSIITCGIYAIIWYYQAGKSLAKIKAMRNMPGDSSMEIVYLLLGIFGLGIVSLALIQNEVNNIIDVSMSGGGYGYGNQYGREYSNNQLHSGYNNVNQYNNKNNVFNNSDFEKHQVNNNGQNNNYNGNAKNSGFQNNSNSDVHSNKDNQDQNGFNNSENTQ